MTAIRPIDRPAPLDIASLHIGPPLDAEGDEVETTGNAVVLHRAPTPPSTHGADWVYETPEDAPREKRPNPQIAAKMHADDIHVRYMTPRQMLLYSENLYAAGIISFDDYEKLAFQPDLHPDFARTIGALTGDKPQPDRPRDFIRRWQDRLEFAQRYHPANSHEVRQAFRILEVLKGFQRQSEIFA